MYILKKTVMTEAKNGTKIDGRIQRSERSSQAIVDALLALIEEGTLVPTAQQISSRAGVGIRTLFRQFSDMDSLFDALDMQLRDSYEAFFSVGDRSGTLAQRLQYAIERRAAGYEKNKLLMQSTRAHAWKSASLQKNYRRAQRDLRSDLEDWLPEIKSLPAAQQEAVDMLASPESWHRLREEQGLAIETAIAVVVDTVALLVAVD